MLSSTFIVQLDGSIPWRSTRYHFSYSNKKNVIMVPSMVFGQIYGIFSSFDLGDVIAFYFELNNCIMLARGSSQ